MTCEPFSSRGTCKVDSFTQISISLESDCSLFIAGTQQHDVQSRVPALVFHFGQKNLRSTEECSGWRVEEATCRGVLEPQDRKSGAVSMELCSKGAPQLLDRWDTKFTQYVHSVQFAAQFQNHKYLFPEHFPCINRLKNGRFLCRVYLRKMTDFSKNCQISLFCICSIFHVCLALIVQVFWVHTWKLAAVCPAGSSTRDLSLNCGFGFPRWKANSAQQRSTPSSIMPSACFAVHTAAGVDTLSTGKKNVINSGSPRKPWQGTEYAYTLGAGVGWLLIGTSYARAWGVLWTRYASSPRML